MRGQLLHKVFQNPIATRRTQQSMDVRISSSATLLLLPSPVTCFAQASYSQKQRFILEDETASLILLDAFTSGRMARGEEWQFQRYRSENEVFIGQERVLKDVMLLENSLSTEDGGKSSLASAMAGYSCYANLFFFGPATATLQAHFAVLMQSVMQYRSSSAPSFIWSYSELLSDKPAAVVRVAGKSTEQVQEWLCREMTSLEETLGPDLYRQVWS
jgi:urease accessory protein